MECSTRKCAVTFLNGKPHKKGCDSGEQEKDKETKTIMRGLAFCFSKEISEDEFGYG